MRLFDEMNVLQKEYMRQNTALRTVLEAPSALIDSVDLGARLLKHGPSPDAATWPLNNPTPSTSLSGTVERSVSTEFQIVQGSDLDTRQPGVHLARASPPSEEGTTTPISDQDAQTTSKWMPTALFGGPGRKTPPRFRSNVTQEETPCTVIADYDDGTIHEEFRPPRRPRPQPGVGNASGSESSSPQ